MEDLLQHGWLSRCPRRFQQAVLERGKARRYAASEFVFHLADGPAGVFGIASGSFSLIAATERNVPRVGHVMHPGGWFGEGPLMSGERRRLAVQACTAGEVVCLSLEEIEKMCSATPAWHRLFGLLAFENLAVAASIVTDLQLRRSESRLAAVLLRAAGRTVLAPDRVLIPVSLSQAELGEMANVSRQVVNATLRRWQAAGWIDLRYGEVVVNDRERLLDCTAE
ncbi:Crp/Fnr family transcriptional regulator [Wenzhouxiangella sp. XN24]|uniref:Crp/Fnr family transcriptional regulator n=1 Tax=Wenzhouxiangella sp. XN24 TaxID=2713569 RepID=UPI0013EB6D0D|nr:Crp/Fnr family transcriptional regulator [Wenzhouxiangella sp. XN24]NGX17182.1 Crp/Fnr family transcriptional regulator [Wenzhouxiangella sp. XN24]